MTNRKLTVTYVNHMGSDVSVVNAARVSFAKTSTADPDGTLKERDARLIAFLAQHSHWSPFAHTSVTLHVRAPIFVARQLAKHQVGGVWNEVSRRYVDDPPEFFEPETWRRRAENVKQGSSDEAVDISEWYYPALNGVNTPLNEHFIDLMDSAKDLYTNLLAVGVAPEQARMILPQSAITEWYWTGSVAFFARVFNERSETSAQRETQAIAHDLGQIMSGLYPVSWSALISQ